jgi:hypothetical protein
MKRTIEGSGQGVGEGGFADAGDVLDQQVAAREERREGQLNDFLFALDGAPDRFLDRGETRVTSWDRLRLQFRPFCYRIYGGTGD